MLTTLEDIDSAAAVVYRAMPPTPQYAWPMLAQALGTEAWLKHENHTPLGAFKVRGGLTYFDALSRGGAVTGVIGATRGNHGQSMAFAARRAGLRCVVVVPRGNSREKNAAMRALGAELIEHGDDFQAAREHAAALAQADGLHFVASFHPALVRRAMDGLWERTTPQRLLDARLTAVDVSLRRAFGDDLLGSTELADGAALLRRAAEVACEQPEGRPLFAGHARLPWPDEPHLVLWHAQTLLREFRGDGHIAALVTEGLAGLDALVSHAASGDVPAAALQATRAWSDDEWAAGIASMADRGLVHDDGSFTDAGREQRDRIEATTDRLAVAPYAALGTDGCARLRAIGKVLSTRVVEAGLLAIDPRRSLDDSA